VRTTLFVLPCISKFGGSVGGCAVYEVIVVELPTWLFDACVSKKQELFVVQYELVHPSRSLEKPKVCVPLNDCLPVSPGRIVTHWRSAIT
jgi:hypothetical protein